MEPLHTCVLCEHTINGPHHSRLFFRRESRAHRRWSLRGRKPISLWAAHGTTLSDSSRAVQVETKDWKIERPEMAAKVRMPPLRTGCRVLWRENRWSKGPWAADPTALG